MNKNRSETDKISIHVTHFGPLNGAQSKFELGFPLKEFTMLKTIVVSLKLRLRITNWRSDGVEKILHPEGLI